MRDFTKMTIKELLDYVDSIGGPVELNCYKHVVCDELVHRTYEEKSADELCDHFGTAFTAYARGSYYMLKRYIEENPDDEFASLFPLHETPWRKERGERREELENRLLDRMGDQYYGYITIYRNIHQIHRNIIAVVRNYFYRDDKLEIEVEGNIMTLKLFIKGDYGRLHEFYIIGLTKDEYDFLVDVDNNYEEINNFLEKYGFECYLGI